ncbi:MAG: hypothetical protein VX738_02630 [Planctomycetota bacterium]|nr:hypothetical protein [Planctomycetota bacterium]
MGIRFICPSCDNKLNVKSYLAGKRGICPDCRTRIRIPEQDPSDSKSYQVAKLAEDKPRVPLTVERCLAEKPDLNWYLRPETGGEFGPATNEVLGSWISENRVGSNTQLRREDWITWKTATDIFIDFSSANGDSAASTDIEQELPAASRLEPSSTTKIVDGDVDLSNDDFLATLEYQGHTSVTDKSFANLEIDQSTMAQRNLQSRVSSKNSRYTGIVLGILSVVLLGSLVAVVVLAQS